LLGGGIQGAACPFAAAWYEKDSAGKVLALARLTGIDRNHTSTLQHVAGIEAEQPNDSAILLRDQDATASVARD
jgi:hypothetical protein